MLTKEEYQFAIDVATAAERIPPNAQPSMSVIFKALLQANAERAIGGGRIEVCPDYCNVECPDNPDHGGISAECFRKVSDCPLRSTP
jgi:hypothetical protein